MRNLLKLAIIGKPNVGKSTLFNKICRKKLSTVDEMPGITRDIKQYNAKLFNAEFIALDTAGWDAPNNDIESMMMAQTKKAIDLSDALLLMLDGKEGITELDTSLIQSIRKSTEKPLILVVNKADANMHIQMADIYGLGINVDPIYISAEHKLGMDSLHNAIKQLIIKAKNSSDLASPDSTKKHQYPITMAGKPNAGKSTIFNGIVQKYRSITSPTSGTTRDAISENLDCISHYIEIIDTAGLPKRKNNDATSPFIAQSITAIRRARIVLLVMDATHPLERQDLIIAKMAINEGKGLIIIFNKIDLISAQQLKKLKTSVNINIKNIISDLCAPQIIYLSAIKKIHIENFMKAIDITKTALETKIGTAKLNKWLHNAISKHEPPLLKHKKRLKFKYATQKSINPPTFEVFANFKDVPASYIRYLKHSLATEFHLIGIPVRLNIKVTDNPYEK